jgi:hypothetical protein
MLAAELEVLIRRPQFAWQMELSAIAGVAMAWATKALDEVRREVWNDARHRGEHAHARQLKRTRYAVWRNQENLTERQQRKLAWLEQVNRPLFRAYLLKENLRLVFQLPFDLAVELLRMSPARVSEMPPRR